MKKRTITQYAKMYKFAEKRQSLAESKNLKSYYRWNSLRLDVMDWAWFSGYTLEELLTGSEIHR